MRVKCVLCDEIGQLQDDTPLAKKLRNHPINTYMCDQCNERITNYTNLRVSTGKFIFHRSSHSAEDKF
ncbi:YlaI family protein [Sporosarcina thermotolerans]|uniref:YlaI family protein n=1 Tax=Sporosarcina thermotolerans TaxID=633404 RepID=A0AAW9A3W1_9BACL|nr:YlaI family protein [Sporosarcina thermotolerans]MDW0115861.1 YlaI family protein [Sporosarcina thermotolerans]WHT46913.1 YlaI family protein [Sporosarcina thermotolerans]